MPRLPEDFSLMINMVRKDNGRTSIGQQCIAVFE